MRNQGWLLVLCFILKLKVRLWVWEVSLFKSAKSILMTCTHIKLIRELHDTCSEMSISPLWCVIKGMLKRPENT